MKNLVLGDLGRSITYDVPIQLTDPLSSSGDDPFSDPLD